MSKGVLYAVTAGFIGAIIWAAIAYYAEYELGLLAWGIGAAVGAAMMAGVQEKAGPQTGAIALAIALVSIVGGKYFAVEMIFNDIDGEWDTEIARLATDETYAISWVADDVVNEYIEAEKPLDFPPNANLDSPESASDYPADVWAEATARWQAMTDQEKQAYREGVIAWQKQAFSEMSGALKTEGFLASFSFFDILWFALGGISAFKLGSGVGGE